MAPRHGRGRTLAAHAKKSVVRVPVDPRRLARWKQLRGVLDTRRREEAEGYDAYWEAVGEILAASLFVDGGYETQSDFLRTVVKEPKRTVLRHVRVARYASPSDEARYGVAVIDAAIMYLEAKLGAPLKDRLPFPLSSLKVDVVVDGAKHRVDLDRVSVDQLRAATAALTKAQGKSRVVASPSHEAIAKAVAPVKTLATMKVHVEGGFVSFTHVPLFAVHELVMALRGVELPAEEPKKKARPKPTKK